MNAQTIPELRECLASCGSAAPACAPCPDPGPGFPDLLAVAGQLLDCPVSLLWVARAGVLVPAAGRGLPMPPAHGDAFCAAISAASPLLVTADASTDPRFRHHPLVALPDGVRFFVAAGLFDDTGALVGILGAGDRRPRVEPPARTLAILGPLARVATRVVEREALERCRGIVGQIAEADFSALVVVDDGDTVAFANAAAHALLGPACTEGASIAALVPPSLQDDPADAARWLAAADVDVAAATPASRELRIRDGLGELRALEAVRCTWATARGHGMALVLRDAQAAFEPHQRDARALRQDALTGLPNREALLASLDALHVQDRPMGVALVGLDNFRAVNDTLGHTVGDTVLQVVACRLLAWIPADAHLARFGGDEFAIVFPAALADAIEAKLATMLRELARPCEIDHQRVHVEACVGLAIADDAGQALDTGELLARAGLAMRHAKRGGSQQMRRFHEGMRTEAVDRRRLDLELRRAYRDNEFELHYQPQIDLASGRPAGAEALLRWRHPERGLLMPVDFIDALAQSAIAPSVGRWILQRACADAAAWDTVDGRRLKVGVNLFPAQFDDEALADEVDQALVLSGLPAAQLELELTETIALRDDGVAEKTLMRLRKRGIRVSYDDFGTGHASLSMLHRLPVDRVKIDRSFVRDVIDNRGDEAIVRSIALIARNFDMQVIAEGVETEHQAQLLRSLGCQEVQGFLYSRALAPGDFERWLAANGGAGVATAGEAAHA
jgi:diguanylate cyclase (GGDEF)-like protein